MVRILIIDDSEVIRNLLKDFLIDCGYEVELAVDGQEGIEKACQGNYDIAICDIHMPRKNGYQVFKEVSIKKPKTCFIMTDSLPDELAEMALEAGAHQCLTKPFDLDQVRATLDILVKQRQRV